MSATSKAASKYGAHYYSHGFDSPIPSYLLLEGLFKEPTSNPRSLSNHVVNLEQYNATSSIQNET